jgi:transposase InsO family protein
VPPDIRDDVVDFVREWTEKTEIPLVVLLRHIGIAKSKYYDWRQRYGQVNEHNAWVPRDHWLLATERDAMIRYYYEHPLDGCRRLAFMMLDEDVAAASPSTVYRVLLHAGVLAKHVHKPSKKGTGFEQPLKPHEHWHVDVAYLNIGGTFFYLCSVLDGYSRYLVHYELRECMKEADVELIIQRAKEMFPGVTPRIISDNGPQFIAKDFKEFIRLAGMTHVRTSPFYPQSNGKIERWHHSLKSEAVRLAGIRDYAHAQQVLAAYIGYYNNTRLNSAIGYIAPADKLAGREKEIFAERDRKLEEARARRAKARQEAA